MQKGWYGNKTAMIERDAKELAESHDCITPDLLITHAKQVQQANLAFKHEREKAREPDQMRVSRAYADLHALIDRAAKEGVK